MNRRKTSHRNAVLALWVAASVCSTTLAAAGDEPRLEQLAKRFKTPELSLGVLLQSVADFQSTRRFPGQNGFSIATFRLNLKGELDGQYGYFLQSDFARTRAVLDARMYYRVSPAVAIDVGQFKAPFSYEFLTSAASIDFVNRAQVVTALAPNRQIGLQVRTRNQASTIGLDFGVFNGNGIGPNGNDSNHFMFAARLAGHRDAEQSDGTRTIIDGGVNLAFSHDASASFGGGFVSGFSGDRSILGGDVRVVHGRGLLAGEVMYASLDPDVGSKREPAGLHITAGYMVRDGVQLLVRWDGFDPDAPGGRSDWLILGVNLTPTSAVGFQINDVIDTDRAGLEHHQLLVNFQFGF